MGPWGHETAQGARLKLIRPKALNIGKGAPYLGLSRRWAPEKT
jgi:hypothetical protein